MEQASDARVAVEMSAHGGPTDPRVSDLVDLLCAIHDVTAALEEQNEHDELPVDPVLLNVDDFTSTDTMEEVVAALRADGALEGLPRPGRPTDGVELRTRRVDLGGSVFVELAGPPTVLVALWLLTSIDGEFKVTEEYSIAGENGTDVCKRVSFTTPATLPELTAAIEDHVA